MRNSRAMRARIVRVPSITPALVAAMALTMTSALAAAVTGCGGSPTMQTSMANLKSPSAGQRQEAADELRDDGGPTPEATRALLEAIKTETDEHAYGAMLIALGASGAPEAEPYICAKVYATEARMRTWAKKAHKLYLEKNRSSQGCPPPGATPPAPAGAVPGAPLSSAPAASSTSAAPSSNAPTGVPIGPK